MSFIVNIKQIEEAFLSLIEEGVSVKISECAYIDGEMISGDLHARRLNFGYRVSFGYQLVTGNDYIELGTIINAIPNRLSIDNVKEVKYKKLVGDSHLPSLYMMTGGTYRFNTHGKVILGNDKCIHVFDIIIETTSDDIIDFFEDRVIVRKKETKSPSKSPDYFDYKDYDNVFHKYLDSSYNDSDYKTMWK